MHTGTQCYLCSLLVSGTGPGRGQKTPALWNKSPGSHGSKGSFSGLGRRTPHNPRTQLTKNENNDVKAVFLTYKKPHNDLKSHTQDTISKSRDSYRGKINTKSFYCSHVSQKLLKKLSLHWAVGRLSMTSPYSCCLRRW